MRDGLFALLRAANMSVAIEHLAHIPTQVSVSAGLAVRRSDTEYNILQH